MSLVLSPNSLVALNFMSVKIGECVTLLIRRMHVDNKINFIIFSTCLLTANCFGTSGVFNEFETLMASTKQLLEETRQYTAKALRQAEQSVKSFGNQTSLKAGLDVSEEKEVVQVAIKLPKSQDGTTGAEKVDIEAKGNSLEGTLNCGDYTAKIAITDGQVVRISYKYSTKEEVESKDGNKSFKQVSSVSTQSIVLPARVNNLENAKAELSEGRLLLTLPKEAATTRGWRRIEVK